jgi:pyruvate,orthophosphate dikinase
VASLVYPFDAELDPDARLQLLGRKAAGLNEMTRLGIPVPPGFTISTEADMLYRRDGHFPETLNEQVERAVADVEAKLGRGFGNPANPLLFSVRSGAAVSMPGMMDTVLNVGLTESSLAGLADRHGDPRFALDAYRRLLQMYGTIVRGISFDRFQGLLSERKAELGRPRMLDSELPVESLEALIADSSSLIEAASGSPFPQDAYTQLWDAITAVFASWDNARAQRYRKMERIDESLGTACSVQAMVFGNAGPDSGSGVAFTRNPSTGDKELYGEYLANAQGEDVVAGIRTPVAMTRNASPPGKEAESLEQSLPEAFEAIAGYCRKLEAHFGDMQDIEFTIEHGRPFLLQTRRAKRTARAAVRVAVAMVKEGVLDREQALLRVDARSLGQLIQARLPDPEELAARGVHPIATGLPASPGAASGRIVFEADEAARWAAEGQDVILVRHETSAEDIHGMKAAQGVVTAAGGMTSHAAVVARGLGKCCVVGCGALQIDYRRRRISLEDDAELELGEGDLLSLDGVTGRVYAGALDVVASPTVAEFEELISWADEVRQLRVYADADTPQAARAALSYGAEGVGLCRTERMFFAHERLRAMRCALLSAEPQQRARWLKELEGAQREDFAQIFEAMQGRLVAIRLLDRPNHEFLPRDSRGVSDTAAALGVSEEEVRNAVRRQSETNPGFGHRGVRAGLTVLGLYDMQLRAMIQAARDCIERGVPVELEIIVPMVAFAEEMQAVQEALEHTLRDVFGTGSAPHPEFRHRLAAMIELPRACMVADEVARFASVFSFGGNDLTQAVLGISRQDASRFLPAYLDERELIARDPFSHLDERSVVSLMRMAMTLGRRQRPELIAGLCGEHGGDPDSIKRCVELGMDFVSCSLPKLPGARLAAAQARLLRKT